MNPNWKQIIAAVLVVQQLLLPVIGRAEGRERPEVTRDRLKTRPMDDYLPALPAPSPSAAPGVNAIEANAIDAATAKRFEADLNEYLGSLRGITLASGKQFIDAAEFKEWWEASGRARFMNRAALSSLRGVSLEAFVTTAWLAHLAEVARAKGDPSWFQEKLQDLKESRLVNWGLYVSGAIVFGLGGWIVEKAIDALVNGPGSDIMRNLAEPISRPFIHKSHQISSKKLEKPSERLTHWLNPTPEEAPVTEETMANAREGAKQVKAKLAELRTELLRMNFAGMSDKSLGQTRTKMQGMWTSALTVYNKTIPEALRRGRDLTVDAVAFRPLHYIYTASIFDTNYQVHKQHYRESHGRLLAGRADDAEFRRAVEDFEKRVHSIYAARLAANEQVTPTREHLATLDEAERAYRAGRQELLDRGASPAAVADLEENLNGRIRARKQIVANMVASIFHDAGFREYSEEMSPEIRRATRVMQANLGLDFFVDDYQPEIVEMFQKMDMMLEDSIIHGDSIVRARAQLLRQIEGEERVHRALAEQAKREGRAVSEAAAAAETVVAPATAPATASGKCAGFKRLWQRVSFRGAKSGKSAP